MRVVDGLDLNGQRATNAATPTTIADVSNKQYTDAGDAGRLRYVGTWDTVSGYAVNDLVVYAGKTYVCTSPVVPASASSVVGSATYTTDTGAADQNMSLPTGSAAGDILVWLCNVTVANAQAVTIVLPGTAVATTSVAFASLNKIVGQLNTYTLVSSDIVNGYVTLPSQASNNPIKVTSQFYSFRNVFTTSNVTTTATMSTAAQTPTSVAYIVSMTGVTLGGGTPQTISQAQLSSTLVQVTALLPNVTTSNHGSAMVYETVPANTATTTRLFTTPSSTKGYTFAYQLVQNVGSNPTPDSTTGAGNWTLLAILDNGSAAATAKTALAVTAGTPGWRNYAAQAPLAYSKSRDLLVTIEGYIQPGTAASVAGTTYAIATLPVGARPLDGSEYFPAVAYPVSAAAILCRVQVDTTGVIRLYTPVSVPLSAGVTVTGAFMAQQ